MLHHLKPVAGNAVNDRLCAVINGFSPIHDGAAVLMLLNILNRGNTVAERFSAVAYGAATRDTANDIKSVLDFGNSDVNVKMHFYCMYVCYNTIQYYIFKLFFIIINIILYKL